MCGIIGYIGKNNALSILLDGLKRMEYRGYDSSGIAICDGGDVFCVKAVGKIRELEEKLEKGNGEDGADCHHGDVREPRFQEPRFPEFQKQNSSISDKKFCPKNGLSKARMDYAGIAHTRWATHGAPTEANAHPHTDCYGNIWIVHNGIIENYKELKDYLLERGHAFKSETDSEVIAHLIEDIYNSSTESIDPVLDAALSARNSGLLATSKTLLAVSSAQDMLPTEGTAQPAKDFSLPLGRSGHLARPEGKALFLNAVIKALKLLKGAYGLVVMHKSEPDKLIAAKFGSPLLIGLGNDETIIASDASAVLRHTKQVVYLDDGEVAKMDCGNLEIYDLESQKIDKKIQEIEWDISQAEKQGYPHFMLKEIFEQPEAVINSTRGRLLMEEGKAKLGGLDSVLDRIRQIENIIIVACGTACHAGLVGEYMLEEYAGMPTEVEYASEFRYRKPVFNPKTAVLAISQSGETADTLAAIKEAQEKGILTLGIVNAVGSTIARATDAGVYNHIGPEIAVASTKVFISQLAILALMTLFIGRQRGMSLTMGERIAEELSKLPEKIRQVLKLDSQIKAIAEKYRNSKNFFFMGRKYNYPVALEGALKLKEISYIHAAGQASGELKHGAIALIDENFPSFFIAPVDSVYEKNLSNMEEIKARKGPIIAITTEGNEELKSITRDIIYIPKTLEMLTPILSVIPLQLFAYHAAVLNGRDVDKPRNLAKSVTVE